MFENLISLDRSVFLFFNRHHSLYWDQVMWVYTGRIIWIPLVLMLAYVLFKKNWKEGLFAAVMIGLAVTLSDQTASAVFKPLFERLRPAWDPDFSPYVTIVNGYTGGRYGFASSHAANGIALALFTSLLFRRKWYTFTAFLWAAISCYSRMYVGVHYPGDILGGLIIGTVMALFVYYCLYLPLHRIFFVKGIFPSARPVYERSNDSIYVMGMIYFIFIFILIASPLINFAIK
ncbi:phosphatase PAP2 family protein [Coprobacter tertius]|uniref:Phosphatase PAP2 family protein n=1 Tax=Coprobacter tertius TaxID=2944915 RepID=A0ABT1MGX5_9BACT|nr:phosphatase PAP2 family protein [Coprobacter tertius]MCP9611875.1 phosphatase PAP2 family protein [Coprobacter tertius]